MAIYFTDSKKAALKKRLRMSFKGRLVGELVDEIEAALADVLSDEAAEAIAAGNVYNVEPDTALDTAITADTGLGETDAQDLVDADLTQPDVPRQLKVVTSLGGATLTGNVVIEGVDVKGSEISETVALNNDADPVTDRCFAEVTKVTLPAWTTSGDSISIGTTAKIGFPVLLTKDTIYMALVDGAQDTLPTVTVHATDVAQVIVEPNTVPNGAKEFDFYYKL